MKIIIGTKNKAKAQAVINACSTILQNPEFMNLDVPSEVSDQPIGDEETLRGAGNRARNAMREGNGDLAFGLEGGVRELDGKLFVCNWGVLQLKDGTRFIAGGAQIPLPEEVAKPVRAGEELGPVMERYTQNEGIRQNEGAVGVFTVGIVNRGEMFEHIVKLLIGQYLKAR